MYRGEVGEHGVESVTLKVSLQYRSVLPEGPARDMKRPGVPAFQGFACFFGMDGIFGHRLPGCAAAKTILRDFAFCVQ